MLKRLTVTIPTYNSPVRKLDRAVDSVLNSLPDHCRLIVVNDGGQEPSLWPDPRLDVWNLTANRGRYFADAVVISTLTDNEFWSPHDSDDWSDKGRFGPLLDRAADVGAVVAPMFRHEERQKPRVQHVDFTKADAPRVRHVAHWCTGVYNVGRVRQAGNLLLNVRTSYDHALVMSVIKHGPAVASRTPSYHWERRRGSLTTSKETAIGSRLRADERRLIDRVWARIRDGEDATDVVAEVSGQTLLNELQSELSRLASIA